MLFLKCARFIVINYMDDFYSEYVLQKAQTGNMKLVVSVKGNHCIVCTINIRKDKWYVFTSSCCYKCEAKITQRQEQLESQAPFLSSWASGFDSCLYTFRTQLSMVPFYTIIPAIKKIRTEKKKIPERNRLATLSFPGDGWILISSLTGNEPHLIFKVSVYQFSKLGACHFFQKP